MPAPHHCLRPFAHTLSSSWPSLQAARFKVGSFAFSGLSLSAWWRFLSEKRRSLIFCSSFMALPQQVVNSFVGHPFQWPPKCPSQSSAALPVPVRLCTQLLSTAQLLRGYRGIHDRQKEGGTQRSRDGAGA